MHHILAPLGEYAASGLVLRSGYGLYYRTHPVFAAFCGDYPEQILAACCITGDCPQCTIPKALLGNDTAMHARRNLSAILRALAMVDESMSAFVRACNRLRIKPVFEPFWQSLPYSNIYLSITPDLLHQLYQGVLKHLKTWIFQVYSKAEIDS